MKNLVKEKHIDKLEALINDKLIRYIADNFNIKYKFEIVENREKTSCIIDDINEYFNARYINVFKFYSIKDLFEFYVTNEYNMSTYDFINMASSKEEIKVHYTNIGEYNIIVGADNKRVYMSYFIDGENFYNKNKVVITSKNFKKLKEKEQRIILKSIDYKTAQKMELI